MYGNRHTAEEILHGLRIDIAQYFNPSSPKDDQHKFSPSNISTSLRAKVMKTNKMITKGKIL